MLQENGTGTRFITRSLNANLSDAKIPFLKFGKTRPYSILVFEFTQRPSGEVYLFLRRTWMIFWTIVCSYVILSCRIQRVATGSSRLVSPTTVFPYAREKYRLLRFLLGLETLYFRPYPARLSPSLWLWFILVTWLGSVSLLQTQSKARTRKHTNWVYSLHSSGLIKVFQDTGNGKVQIW